MTRDTARMLFTFYRRGAVVAIVSYVVAALVVFAVCAAAITHIYTTYIKGNNILILGLLLLLLW